MNRLLWMKVCVYTTLIGNYENLNEQAVARGSAVPFICLTDDPDLRSDSWIMRQVHPTFVMDPIRSQRDLKIRPHLHVGDFDASIYIDNSILLKEDPASIFDRYYEPSGFTLMEHSFRDSLCDEFLEIARHGIDDPQRVFEQLNHYTFSTPELLDERPFWAGFLLRDHRDPSLQRLAEIWIAHLNRYSRRDQLSFNIALRLAGVTPHTLQLDNHDSWFHSWPHKLGREHNKGPRQLVRSLTSPLARVHELERLLREREEQHRFDAEGLRAVLLREEEQTRSAAVHVAAQHERALADLNAKVDDGLERESQMHRALMAETAARDDDRAQARSEQDLLQSELKRHQAAMDDLCQSRAWRVLQGLLRTARKLRALRALLS